MPELTEQGQHLRLLVTRPERVLRLQGGDRVDGVGTADGVQPGLGQSDVADLAFGHELRQHADDLLDRSVRIDPMLVVEIDVVGAEPAQRALQRHADVVRAAVRARSAGVRHEAELGGQDGAFAAALECSANQLLVRERPVDLGGVDQGDPEIQRPVDCADGFGVVGSGPGVRGGHAHRPQTNAPNVECTQLDVLHSDLLVCGIAVFLGGIRSSALAVPGVTQFVPAPRIVAPPRHPRREPITGSLCA